MNRNQSAVLLASALLLWGMAAKAQDAQSAAVVPDAQAPAPTTVPQATSAEPVMTAPRTSNKWRIEFDESSKSDGTITFRVWTEGDTTIDVPVSVRNNQSENSIARATRNAFRRVLGRGYHVETDDGEDVLIKVRGNTPHFGLALVSSTAKDVDVSVGRE